MAFVIKNPPVNHVKKTIVSENIDVNAIIDNSQDKTVPDNPSPYSYTHEEGHDTEEVKVVVDDANNEPHLVDGKLIFKGVRYIPEELLNKYVEDEINSRKEELDIVREENIQLGRDEGYQEGLRLAAEEYQESNASIRKLFEKTSLMYEELVGKSEDLLKETVYMAICKTFGVMLGHEDERVNVIQNVITEIKNTNLLKIKVSQADYQLIINDEDSDLADNYNIEIDNRVEIGGCIVETDKGTFDGRLEVQLAKLREAVLV